MYLFKVQLVAFAILVPAGKIGSERHLQLVDDLCSRQRFF